MKLKFCVLLISFSEEEIPRVSVSKADVLQHGDNFTIVCNLTTDAEGSSGLKRISWYKNGVIQEIVKNPDPKKPQEFLRPLLIKNALAKDGGNYTCLLEVLLRKVKEHNVSDTSIIRSEFACSLPIYLIKEASGPNRRQVPQIRRRA